MNERAVKFVKNCRDFKAAIRQDTSLDLKVVDADETVIPFELYRGKRQNIEKLANQVNKSYSNAIFDGASVLMRKLTEILLILSYKQCGQEDSIKNTDGYKPLSEIIDNAVNNKILDFTRGTKGCLRDLKNRGDQSAHNPFYACTQADIDAIKFEFRVAFEELMHKAGIVT